MLWAESDDSWCPLELSIGMKTWLGFRQSLLTLQGVEKPGFLMPDPYFDFREGDAQAIRPKGFYGY